MRRCTVGCAIVKLILLRGRKFGRLGALRLGARVVFSLDRRLVSFPRGGGICRDLFNVMFRSVRFGRCSSSVMYSRLNCS